MGSEFQSGTLPQIVADAWAGSSIWITQKTAKTPKRFAHVGGFGRKVLTGQPAPGPVRQLEPLRRKPESLTSEDGEILAPGNQQQQLIPQILVGRVGRDRQSTQRL